MEDMASAGRVLQGTQPALAVSHRGHAPPWTRPALAMFHRGPGQWGTWPVLAVSHMGTRSVLAMPPEGVQYPLQAMGVPHLGVQHPIQGSQGYSTPGEMCPPPPRTTWPCRNRQPALFLGSPVGVRLDGTRCTSRHLDGTQCTSKLRLDPPYGEEGKTKTTLPPT